MCSRANEPQCFTTVHTFGADEPRAQQGSTDIGLDRVFRRDRPRDGFCNTGGSGDTDVGKSANASQPDVGSTLVLVGLVFAETLATALSATTCGRESG